MAPLRLPTARTDRLLVEEIVDETLVYDLERDRAHCLNPTARLVWSLCDGRTTPARAAERLADELGLPADESLVWMAVHRLDRAKLLASPVDAPASRTTYSRREVVRALGLGAGLTLLLPAVDSIVVPLAAAQASCITLAQCQTLPKNACTGLPICGNKTQCCQRQGQGCSAKAC